MSRIGIGGLAVIVTVAALSGCTANLANTGDWGAGTAVIRLGRNLPADFFTGGTVIRSVDGQFLPTTYLRVLVSPGEHEIGLWHGSGFSGRTHPVRVTAEAGHEYRTYVTWWPLRYYVVDTTSNETVYDERR